MWGKLEKVESGGMGKRGAIPEKAVAIPLSVNLR